MPQDPKLESQSEEEADKGFKHPFPGY